jgi:CheY-like chemotaxis protein
MIPACILVVDDNPTNLKLAVDVLEFEGHIVLRAENADQAQQIVKQQPPDLILMDIQMPGMDGYTLTRRLKSDPATGHIPIIAMTSFAMKGDDQKARDAGCDGYLTKPIDTRKLPGQVADFLAQARVVPRADSPKN